MKLKIILLIASYGTIQANTNKGKLCVKGILSSKTYTKKLENSLFNPFIGFALKTNSKTFGYLHFLTGKNLDWHLKLNILFGLGYNFNDTHSLTFGFLGIKRYEHLFAFLHSAISPQHYHYSYNTYPKSYGNVLFCSFIYSYTPNFNKQIELNVSCDLNWHLSENNNSPIANFAVGLSYSII